MEFSPGKILLLLFFAFLLFGAKKLPDMGRAAGNALREFKNATNGLMSDDDSSTKKKESTNQSNE